MKNIKIKYIQHSGFVVELNDRILIFDYFKGNLDLNKDKPVYVFSSHVHSDHFNPQILDWEKEYPHVCFTYIFSYDIRPKVKSSMDRNITYISAYESLQIDDISIKAYGSTDEGVSFLVKSEEHSILHAGDLNWWYWWGDTKENIQMAEQGFKEEISEIKGESIDIAFFPVDPRLEHNDSLGAEYFIKEIKPKILIPMHFWNNEKPIHDFADKMKDSPTKIILLTTPGQEITLAIERINYL